MFLYICMIGHIQKIFTPVFKGSISDNDIESFKDATQVYSDCYLMSTLECLANSTNGRKILKESIHHDDAEKDNINCYLYAPNGKKEEFTIPTKNAIRGYEKLYKKQENEIIRSLDISVAQYEKKYNTKPWYCKITRPLKTFRFENNSPSNFMQSLTGIKPISIAEKDFNLDLRKYKNQVMPLLERMSKEKEFSFVIGTGIKKHDGRRFHVYVIENVDMEHQTITVKNKRINKPETMSIDEALKTFKYITGYFNSDLNKNL